MPLGVVRAHSVAAAPLDPAWPSFGILEGNTLHLAAANERAFYMSNRRDYLVQVAAVCLPVFSPLKPPLTKDFFRRYLVHVTRQ